MDLCQQRVVSFYYAVEVYPGVSYVFFRVKTKAVIVPPHHHHLVPSILQQYQSQLLSWNTKLPERKKKKVGFVLSYKKVTLWGWPSPTGALHTDRVHNRLPQLYGTLAQRNLSNGVASLVAQAVKNLPAKQETRVQFLSQEDPLEKEMATFLEYSCLESARDREDWWATQFKGSQRV